MIITQEDILQEVSQYAPESLLRIEKIISKFQQSINDKKIRIKLINELEQFFKIKIFLMTNNEFNAAVIPQYKTIVYRNIIKDIKKNLDSKQSKIKPSRLKSLTSIDESSKYIDFVYLFLGKPLIFSLKPKEILAIILHEMGHIFYLTSNLNRRVILVLKSIMSKSLIIGPVINYFLYSFISFQILIASIVLAILMIRGLTFLDHMDENFADNYALKYGYGDDLIFSLRKIEMYTKTKRSNKIKRITDVFKIIVNFFLSINRVIYPSDHPTIQKRVENLEQQIFNRFKEIYPNYRGELELFQNKYINNSRRM